MAKVRYTFRRHRGQSKEERASESVALYTGALAIIATSQPHIDIACAGFETTLFLLASTGYGWRVMIRRHLKLFLCSNGHFFFFLPLSLIPAFNTKQHVFLSPARVS